MKRIIFLLFIIFILFFLFSCPSELVKKTYWKGSLDSNLDVLESGADNYKSDHDIEIYIHNDNTIRIIIFLNRQDGDTSEITLDGDYTLDDNNYSFTADTEDEDGYFNVSLDGILNTTTGEGSGDCDIEYSWYPSVSDDGTWDVMKVY